MDNKILRILLYIFVILSIVGCKKNEPAPLSSPGVTDTEVIVGSSAAIGGHASFLGTQTLHGSMAYINEVNAKGGCSWKKNPDNQP